MHSLFIVSFLVFVAILLTRSRESFEGMVVAPRSMSTESDTDDDE